MRLGFSTGVLLLAGLVKVQALDESANGQVFSRLPLVPAWMCTLEVNVTVSAERIELQAMNWVTRTCRLQFITISWRCAAHTRDLRAMKFGLTPARRRTVS